LAKVLIGGETLGAGLGATLRALFRPAELIDIYGLTETSTCDFFLMAHEAERYAGCIGRPSPGVRFGILAGDGKVVPQGEIGELNISSPFLMSGYLDEPALTPIRDGWLATGDLARELPAGRTGKADRGRFAAMLEANELVPAGEAVHPMNKYESIRVIRDGHVAQLELHRPDRLNALGKNMLLEINDAMDALEAD